MTRQVFIGGTGRSGTTILYKLLRTHSEIHAFETEMRFIVDYNGVLNLIDALSVNYSVVQSREAVYYFRELMENILVNPSKAPYVGFDFASMFGKDDYRKLIDEFFQSLSLGSFVGSDYPVHGKFLEFYLGGVVRLLERLYLGVNRKVLNRKPVVDNFWPRRRMENIKYFEREEISRVVERFVDSLFGLRLSMEGKSVWCEKTPSNLLHIDRIFEIFPSSKFVHIKRDPRGVVQSMQNQFWADSDLLRMTKFLKQTYKRWFEIKNKMELDSQHYLEIKLEDLVSEYDEQRKGIVDFLGLKDEFINPPELKRGKVDYWKESMPKKDQDLVTSLLSEEILMMGYSL